MPRAAARRKAKRAALQPGEDAPHPVHHHRPGRERHLRLLAGARRERPRTPALTRQIEVLERDGIDSPAYHQANIRATVLGIGLFIPILAILYLMVVKPSLG
ncbi:MAG TPA: hypothetical protein VFR68_10970 [Candidatus Dormibacteraeota bacterium]|nr:hypothetical protein [Candidatus Dormibacteraeota bacterium]